MARQMASQDFHAVEYEGQSYDCGSKLGYLRATMAYARSHPELGTDAQALIDSFAKS